MKNRGAEQLRGLIRPRATVAEIASRLGCWPTAVQAWLSGRNRPREPLRRRLEQEFGIPASSWDEPKREET